jgi:hypothetical protein
MLQLLAQDGFLWSGSYVSSTHLNRPICDKISLSAPENYDLLGILLSKTNSILQANNVLYSAA